MVIKVGDLVICYSCEKCKKQKHLRDKRFEGEVTEIQGNVATILHNDGHRSYNDVRCLLKLTE